MSDDEIMYDDDEEYGEEENEEEYPDEEIELEKPYDLKRQESFEVLESAKMLNETAGLMKEVTDVLQLPNRAIANILLRAYNWNKEQLIAAWLEDSNKVMKKVGLENLTLEKKPSKKSYECLICIEKYSADKTFSLGCGHRYCLACWKEYLEIKIKLDGSACIATRCPSPKCKTIVHEDAFRRIVSKELFDKYSDYLLRSFVDDNPQIKWCPAPGCTYCIRCDRKNRKEAVICKCGCRFCFNCNDAEIGDHMPCPCEQVDAWRQKASDESENVTWLMANTKKCPQCRSPIEKNGGCMHMTCRKNAGGCGFEFCWLCRGPWTEHGSATGGYYSCNKYEKSTIKDEDEKAEYAKTELEYYMFYYHRFESHRNALKIADEQRKSCHKKEQEIFAKFDVRSADTKYLMEAVDVIIESRRVLQYSYVYGFYLKKGTQEKNLFEYLQEDLEKHTNHLSTLYETAVEQISDYHAFIKWKEDVTNYTRVTKKFLEHFVEGVTNGLTSENL